MHVRPPNTESEFEAYYAFRWRILRQPWNQPIGSEKDEFEPQAIHLAAWDRTDKIVGVGRLHRLDKSAGQIRYMAVDPSQRSLGVGKALLQELEQRAIECGMQEIRLNSRQEAVPFYQKHGYQVVRPSHTLFGEIPHFEMWKRLG